MYYENSGGPHKAGVELRIRTSPVSSLLLALTHILCFHLLARGVLRATGETQAPHWKALFSLMLPRPLCSNALS